MYRAPEMCDLHRGEEVGLKVDVWALGCILFALCLREHPFPAESTLQILNAKYTIPPGSPYSESVHDLIRAMLTPEPSLRPSASDVLRAELEALQLELEAAGENLALEGEDVEGEDFEGEDVEEQCKPRDAATQASLPWLSHVVGGLVLGLTLSRPVCGLLEGEERRTPGPDNGSVPSSVPGLGQALH